MSSKSRWADTEEDARLDAKLKEEKRRKRAEKARKLEAQAAAAASLDVDHDRPSKRRRITPEPGVGVDEQQQQQQPPAKLLRFPAGGWSRCRSVENYEKLNDIEEGTYGWVARATDKATGKVVALKRLKLDPADRNGLPVTGLREIQILKDCQHRNIVSMVEVVVGDDVSRPDKYVLPPSFQSARQDISTKQTPPPLS